MSAADVTVIETPAWPDTYGSAAKPRVGFFTDTSICIGCKACEVACKEWNGVPATTYEFTGHSYDNTGDLGADTWRHVAFVEQRLPRRTARRSSIGPTCGPSATARACAGS